MTYTVQIDTMYYNDKAETVFATLENIMIENKQKLATIKGLADDLRVNSAMISSDRLYITIPPSHNKHFVISMIKNAAAY
jgi:hypothetical protein